MENKLELRHLAGYLPYGLKMVRPDRKTVLELHGIAGDLLIFKEDNETYGSILSGNYKPLVIPLSQLTKEDWQQVFVAGCPQFADEFSVEVTENWVILDQCYDISTFDFRYRNFEISHSMPPFDALAAFEKLYSLHADLHGLIEKKLGLNKLDYEK